VFILDETLSSVPIFAGVASGVHAVRHFTNGAIIVTKTGEILFIPSEHIVAIRHRR
jgi:hypothetical protein